MIDMQMLGEKKSRISYLAGIICGIGLAWLFIEVTEFYVRMSEHNKVVNENTELKVKLSNAENQVKQKQDSIALFNQATQSITQQDKSKAVNVKGNNNKVVQ